jgi:hypothetical protein
MNGSMYFLEKAPGWVEFMILYAMRRITSAVILCGTTIQFAENGKRGCI